MQGATYTESAGGVVVSNADGKILVVRQNHDKWSLPKGHVEENEDPIAAARREITEETGIAELDLLDKLGEYKRFKMGRYLKDDESEIKIIHMYLFTTSQRELVANGEDAHEAKWADRKEVATLLSHPKDKEFFVSVLDRLPDLPVQS